MESRYRDLLSEVRNANRSAAAPLRPGLPRDVVEAQLATLPYKITPDAALLYEWADGADGPFELLPGGYFIPLAQAMKQFKVFDELAEDLDQDEEPHRHCFRFLSDWSDGGYAFGRVDSPGEGRIVKLCIHATWQIGFSDLEHLLRTSVECSRQGVIESSDFKRFHQIAARLNPAYHVWRPAR
jgi:hypothetical protein